MVSNEGDTDNAVVCATLVAPAGSPFRIETDPPLCAQPRRSSYATAAGFRRWSGFRRRSA
jgi:hypothetical protein